VEIPGGLKRFWGYWFNGVSYISIVAQMDGTISYDPPSKLVLFNRSQTYRINGVPQSPIYLPPDLLFERSGIFPGTEVKAGDEFVKLRVISGDHLFVDRVTYNFRRPRRGDIVVFETHGIEGIKALNPNSPELWDTYYIKRLCGLPGERLSLRPDCVVLHPRYGAPNAGHLVINGTNEITAATPHFETVYSFPDVHIDRARARSNRELPTVEFHEDHYYGHGLMEKLAPGFTHTNLPNHFFVMGDNTFNSSDSRYWGDFDEHKVIGKSFFVYWPIGGTSYKGEQRESRFGWAHR
jgi:signal peptidase I